MNYKRCKTAIHVKIPVIIYYSMVHIVIAALAKEETWAVAARFSLQEDTDVL